MSVEIVASERLADRFENLYAPDPQFPAPAPSAEVTAAALGSESCCWDVVSTYLDGYADRPALGQRCREGGRDDHTGRSVTSLLPRFETITYRHLSDDVEALSAASERLVAPRAAERRGEHACG